MKSSLILNRHRAKQILGFDDLQFGKCRPTDIDMSMDFQGKVFVFGEIKGYGNGLTMGQKIHLQHMVDAIIAGGRKAVAFLALHYEANSEEDVMVATCEISMIYSGAGRWEYPDESTTVQDFIKRIHEEHTA